MKDAIWSVKHKWRRQWGSVSSSSTWTSRDLFSPKMSSAPRALCHSSAARIILGALPPPVLLAPPSPSIRAPVGFPPPSGMILPTKSSLTKLTHEDTSSFRFLKHLPNSVIHSFWLLRLLLYKIVHGHSTRDSPLYTYSEVHNAPVSRAVQGCTQGLQGWSILLNRNFMPLGWKSSSFFSPWQLSYLSLSLWIRLFSVTHVGKIVQYLWICHWLQRSPNTIKYCC